MTSKISSAFVKAQTAFGPALKTHTNPAFRSKYADLSACIEAVIDALHANGIGLMQLTHPCDDGVVVETKFLHESGESLSGGTLHVPASKKDPQGYGSALSYGRRYSLMAACGIAPEDDDGNAASRKPSAESVKAALRPSGVVADHLAAIEAAADLDSLTAAVKAAKHSAAGDEVLQKRYHAAGVAKHGSLMVSA